MSIFPEKERLTLTEVIVPIVIAAILLIVQYSFFRNGHLTNTLSTILMIISIGLIGIVFFPGIVTISAFVFNRKKKFRLNKLFNSIMWLIICLQLYLLFHFINDTSLAGFSAKILIVPLMAFFYYQMMRVVHIVFYQKEPIMATAYWKKAFEEIEGRKITATETGFTSFYAAFGFLVLVIIYNLF